jgi:integrase
MFTIRTEKTGIEVTAPLLPEVQASLAACKLGELTFLATEHGHPFAKAGFGNWFRDVCLAAKVPGTAHGLRKAGASRAAERGASEAQLNALFGWGDGSNEGRTYVRKANRARMATQAAELLTNKKSRTFIPKSRTSKKKEENQ